MGFSRKQYLLNQIIAADPTKATDDILNGDIEETYHSMINSGLVSLTPPNKNTAVIWGDSYTSKNFVSGTDSYNSRQGYWTWASVLSGQRLKLLFNAGVFGQTSDAILSRFNTDVASYSPGWVVLMCGTNDVASSYSATTIITNLTTMLSKLNSLGAKTILATIPPRVSLTSAQKAVQVQVNRWIREQGRNLPNVYVVDVWQVLIDLTNGQILAGLTNDGIHPNDTGAQRIGRLIANIINQYVPPVDILGHSTDDPLLLNLNPNLTGTTGSLGTGITGSVASSWTTANVSTTTAVASKVARTDNLPGEWQQFAVTQGGVVLSQNQNGVNTAWAVGTKVYAVCEFQLDSGDTAQTNLRLQIQAYNVSFSTTGQVEDFQFIAGDTYATESRVASGVMRTPDFIVPAGTDLRLVVAATYTGVGTVRFGRIGFYKAA